jgi:(+)-pinoresinol hydroxylase
MRHGMGAALALVAAIACWSGAATSPVRAQAPQAQPSAAVLERGEEVYQYWCATCHSSGRGMPGTSALTVKYRGTDTPAVLEERTDLTPQAVAFFVRTGVSSMPFFRKTEISDADLEALSVWLTRRRTP